MNLFWWGVLLGGGPQNPYTPPPDDSEYLWVSDITSGGGILAVLTFDPSTGEGVSTRGSAEVETTGSAITVTLTIDPTT